VVESKHRLATNTSTNVVVSLLTTKYWFSRLRLCHFISSTKICYWWISVFYRELSFETNSQFTVQLL